MAQCAIEKGFISISKICHRPFFCQSVDALQEQNRHVRVVTLDGAATNMSTTKKLGCDYENDEYYLSTKQSSSLSHMMHATSQSSHVRFSHIFSG